MQTLIQITAILIASHRAGSALIGGLISSGTNVIVEWRKSKSEEKKYHKIKEAEALNLRNEAYIKFVGIKCEDLLSNNSGDDEDEFEPDRINDISALVMMYGSSKVSSLLDRSFPLDNWESIEKTKRMILSELILEKGGKLSLTALQEWQELDAYMGIWNGKKATKASPKSQKESEAKSWWQSWKRKIIR